MNLNRGFCEREIAWNVLHFLCSGNFFCEHLQESEEIAEIHILSKHDSLSLIEISSMSRIDLIISETADNSEILPRNLT